MRVPPLHDSRADGPRDHHYCRRAVTARPDAREYFFVRQYLSGHPHRHRNDQLGSRGCAKGRPHFRAGCSANSGGARLRAARLPKSVSWPGTGAIGPMANLRRRSSSLFPGPLLLFVGLLLLLHNYRGLDVFTVIGHWWPLILIFWGAIKLYERMAASRAGDPGAAKITPGEVFLVLGLLSLLGMVVAVDVGKRELPGRLGGWGNSFEFDLEVAPKSVPADARITIRNGRGNISIRPSDEAQIRISGKKKANAWNENDAQQVAERVGVEVVQNGDGYEIRPTGVSKGESRISLDLDVAVPKK